jgi:hypothetical protein
MKNRGDAEPMAGSPYNETYLICTVIEFNNTRNSTWAPLIEQSPQADRLSDNK